MAKTLKEAQNERYKTHYLCKCEYCGGDVVVENGDFDNFYGIPEHKDYEKAWRCPVCGHVNIENSNKDIWKKRCDCYGDNSITFGLSDEKTRC